jgi:exodeoxyribonuclease VII large subunit
MQSPQVLSVTALNNYISRVVGEDTFLKGVTVAGEISGFRNKGHLYFDLKDKTACISCAVWKSNVSALSFLPQDGMQVVAAGHIDFYAPYGKITLIIDFMQPDGTGDMYAKLMLLKEKLEKQGYFDASHKKPLPMYPGTIGVCTSQTGAVIHDIENVIQRRFPLVKILLCPVKVQGKGAAAEVAGALEYLDESGLCDVIIIARGGGSAEDLWEFNDEALVKAVYDCKTPVISAVGHATDVSLCDFAADKSAPTPSAAAELAVPDAAAERAKTDQLYSHILRITQTRVMYEGEKLDNIISGTVSKGPAEYIENKRSGIDEIRRKQYDLISLRLMHEKNRTELLAKTIEVCSPDRVLSRGYALVESGNAAVTDAASLSPGQNIRIRFRDAAADAAVTAVHTGKDDSNG